MIIYKSIYLTDLMNSELLILNIDSNYSFRNYAPFIIHPFMIHRENATVILIKEILNVKEK